MQEPVVKMRRACNLRLPLVCARSSLDTATGRRGVVIEVERTASDSLSYGQRWLRNVKGASSATGDMLYNIGPATMVEQRALEGRDGSLLACHASLTHFTPCDGNEQGHWRKNKDTHDAVDVCVRRAGAHQVDSGLVALVRAVVRSEGGAILGLSKRASLTTGVSRPLWRSDSAGDRVQSKSAA